jgi:F-type H+-transporting ATPase subunit epsilon
MSSSTYYAKIIAADGVFFKGQVRSLIIPEIDGEKEILAHHEDMVIAIDDGLLRFKEEGSDEWRTAVSGRGFVEITHNRVNILLETCERPEDIDRVRAQQAKERAEEKLRQKQSIQEYYHSSAALSRAMARLKATRS